MTHNVKNILIAKILSIKTQRFHFRLVSFCPERTIEGDENLLVVFVLSLDGVCPYGCCWQELRSDVSQMGGKWQLLVMNFVNVMRETVRIWLLEAMSWKRCYFVAAYLTRENGLIC